MNQIQHPILSEPYRLFFPLGWLLALWGASLWVFFGFQWSSAYPLEPHALRMTQAPPARLPELLAVFIPLALLPLLALLTPTRSIGIRIAILAALLSLSWFAYKRHGSRQRPAPPSFVFVTLGLVFAVAGNFILLAESQDLLPEALYPFGRLFFFHGFMLSIVLGVGSRLIPMLLGRFGFNDATRGRFFKLLAAAFFVTLVIEGLGWPLAGLWGQGLFAAHAIHFMHLTFIGGFGLVTFSIATHVVLVHGGFGPTIENKSRSLVWVTAFLLAAALTRLSARLWPQVYLSHLGYAALLWIAGLVFWAGGIGRRISLRRGDKPGEQRR